MYTYLDFEQLNSLGMRELKAEILEAKEYYEEVQEYFKLLEEEASTGIDLPEVEILITQLRNIELYISKATSLLDTKKASKKNIASIKTKTRGTLTTRRLHQKRNRLKLE